ncbi:MAG: hypothetical protein ACTS5I_16740 [Rhodanobacter sp.]
MKHQHQRLLWATALLCSLGGWLVAAHAATTDTTSVSTPAAMPVSDVIRTADFSQVRISPDGRYLSAIVPKPNNPHENVLAILDGRTAKVLNAIPSGKNALIASYFWASNDRLVASVAFKQGGLDAPQFTGELFAITPTAPNNRSYSAIAQAATTH